MRIVPGLIGADEQGVPDVLRGEETEIFGCTTDLGKCARLCLPGTHTKWAQMEEGKIGGFLTSMSGDIFKAIREHTILRGCTQHEPNNDEAFLPGVERAKQAGDLAHHLFGVRTLVLTGAMPDSSASSYLSGLLIGHEVRTMARQGGAVLLVGTPALCSSIKRRSAGLM